MRFFWETGCLLESVGEYLYVWESGESPRESVRGSQELVTWDQAVISPWKVVIGATWLTAPVTPGV